MKVINMHSLWAAPLAVMATLATFATSPAHADMNTIYPGAQCVVASYSPSRSTTNFLGSVGNADTANWMDLYCPVLRDWPSATGVGYGVVAVIDENPGSALSCVLFGVNISGEYAEWSLQTLNEGTTNYPSNNSQFLSFGSLPANDHYYYMCAIPPATGGTKGTSFVNAYSIYQH